MPMSPICQQGTTSVRIYVVGVMVRCIFNWKSLVIVIYLQTSMIGKQYFCIISDEVHSNMFCNYADGLVLFQ